MTRHRLLKLERLLSARPCPECGRTATTSGEDWLTGEPSAADLEELARLSAGCVTTCPRCGVEEFDFTGMSTSDLDRVLSILRPLVAPELAGLIAEDVP